MSLTVTDHLAALLGDITLFSAARASSEDPCEGTGPRFEYPSTSVYFYVPFIDLNLNLSTVMDKKTETTHLSNVTSELNLAIL